MAERTLMCWLPDSSRITEGFSSSESSGSPITITEMLSVDPRNMASRSNVIVPFLQKSMVEIP